MIKTCKTASEVLDKYTEAEKISPAWERVTIFSWDDMLLLKNAIAEKNTLLREAANKIFDQDVANRIDKHFEVDEDEPECSNCEGEGGGYDENRISRKCWKCGKKTEENYVR